jgi:hypothetical protein
MPVDDSDLPFGLEDCRDGSRQARLIRDAVEGVCEENVIDPLRHDRIESHGIRQGKMAVGRTSRSNKCPRLGLESGHPVGDALVVDFRNRNGILYRCRAHR